MSEKLRIKTAGKVSRFDIPYDTEELELECDEIAERGFFKNDHLKKLTLVNVKKIGEHAFGFCEKLQSVTLKNTEKIDEYAFRECNALEYAELINCRMSGKFAFAFCSELEHIRLDCEEISKSSFYRCCSLNKAALSGTVSIGREAFCDCYALQELELPDTLRVIGDDAFWNSDLRRLKIPKDIERLGRHIVRSSTIDIFNKAEENSKLRCVVEVRLKNDTFPFSPGFWPGDDQSVLSVRCSGNGRTGGELFRLMMLGAPENVFTDSGIDLTEYDNMFKELKFNCSHMSDMLLEAALMRINCPYGMSGENFEFFRHYVSALTVKIIKQRYIKGEKGFKTDDIAENPCLSSLTDEDLMELIDHFVRSQKDVEMTAVLMRVLNERRRSGGSRDDEAN